jgi:hypothetical protein
MKPRNLCLLSIPLLMMVLFSCKKDNDNDQPEVQSQATLNAASTGGTIISTKMQTFVLTSVSVAADSGYFFTFPEGGSGPKLKSSSALADYTWVGPDADGWYTRSMSGAYVYYEKLRIGDTIEHILEISYSGGDGSYENITTTKYIKKVKDGKTMYDGYSDWTVHNSGYNDISRWEWRIDFADWVPESNAGTFDWYWGLYENNGGNTTPYHRCEHMVVTETTPDGWLHCRVIFYDDSGVETWDFEYDTPWSPVEIPPIPGWN